MQANGAEVGAMIDHRAPLLADTKGKHRIMAEVKRLEQEDRFLEVRPLLVFLDL